MATLTQRYTSAVWSRRRLDMIPPCAVRPEPRTLMSVYTQEKDSEPQDAAAIEVLMGRVEADGIPRVEEALKRRRRELGFGEEGVSKTALSDVVERRKHADGLLQAEMRRQRRKDGSYSEFGPYWYFHHMRNGRGRSIYLGKTDDPEGTLRAKRGEEKR